MAEKTMTPYQYVHNNPIMFTDPTGMIANAIDGPGDEFKTFEEAFKDFGMTYNGFSIARNIEVSTLFYTYTDENNETKYSYILPHVGANGGMGKKLGPNDLKKFADKMGHKNAQFVNDGHTHGSGEGSHPMKEYKRDSYTTNEFSLGDIQYYVNEKGNPNPWGKRINGSMIAPTGEGFIFDESAHPEVNAGSIDRMYPGKLKKLSVPVIGGLPSDKIFEYSRSGRNSDYSDPKPEWLPVGFKPEEHVRRSGY